MLLACLEQLNPGIRRSDCHASVDRATETDVRCDPYAVVQSNLPCRYRQDSLDAPWGLKGMPPTSPLIATPAHFKFELAQVLQSELCAGF